MKKDSWPHDFFVVAKGYPVRQPKVGIETMGSKGFHLLEMTRIGLNVPSALVIGTAHSTNPHACLDLLFNKALPTLEQIVGMRLGDAARPLTLSVRSGAPVSMPGMMETILNVGLCDSTISGFIRQTGHPRLAWDSYRRLIVSYAETVMGVDVDVFEAELARVCDGRDERELDFTDHRALVRHHLEAVSTRTGSDFPQDARAQLAGAVVAVFASWRSDKANTYRRIHDIDDTSGTAVIIQRMVFGNCGQDSGSGVGFTRDPISGQKQLWVDYLRNAQGEDVVSGRRTVRNSNQLADFQPSVWSALHTAADQLERHFKDMQDIEFTVHRGELFMLQTRAGKRTALAHARITLDLLAEGLIDRACARERVKEVKLSELATTVPVTLDRGSALTSTPIATATPASSGWVSGHVALDQASARTLHAKGSPVILVRQDAETLDLPALELSIGMLTQRGARTSHAAVVARQLGKACLVACSAMRIDLQSRQATFGDALVREGDAITLNGNEGHVYRGEISLERRPDNVLIAAIEELRDAAP